MTFAPYDPLGTDEQRATPTSPLSQFNPALYHQIFDSMISGFGLHEMMFDEMGRPIDYITRAMNPAFTRITGLTPEMLIDRRVLDVLPQLDHHWIELFGTVVLTGTPHRYELYVTPLDRYYEGIAYRSAPGMFAVTFNDITERVLAQRAQARLTRALRTISLCNQTLVRTRDRETLIRLFCQIAVEEGGYRFAWIGLLDPEAPAQLTPAAWHGIDELPFASLSLRPGAYKLLPPSVEAVLERHPVLVPDIPSNPRMEPYQDIARRYELESAVALPLIESNKVLGTITIFAPEKDAFDDDEMAILKELAGDLAFGLNSFHKQEEYEQTRQELHASQERIQQLLKLEAIGQLAGGVAHDFNNLLTAISGSAEMIALALPADSPARTDVEQIREVVDRGAALTRQLLAFARRQPQEPRVIKCHDVVTHLKGLLRRLIPSGILLDFKIEKSEQSIIMDPHQLDQVVMNLVINARDAVVSRPGGIIEIACGTGFFQAREVETHEPIVEGEYCYIRISDNGIGMSAEVREKCIEPFFTTKPIGKGTGLGLSTVYGIIRQAGGYISIDSTEGRGTTITAYIPALAHAEHREETPIKVDVSEDFVSGTILVVDDDSVVRDVVVRALRMEGYEVIEAQDGKEALEMALQHGNQIDLLLTDSVMPIFGGRELARRIRSHLPNVKMLLMSGYSEEFLPARELRGEPIPFIGKPFPITGLLRKVREVLIAPKV